MAQVITAGRRSSRSNQRLPGLTKATEAPSYSSSTLDVEEATDAEVKVDAPNDSAMNKVDAQAESAKKKEKTASSDPTPVQVQQKWLAVGA